MGGDTGDRVTEFAHILTASIPTWTWHGHVDRGPRTNRDSRSPTSHRRPHSCGRHRDMPMSLTLPPPARPLTRSRRHEDHRRRQRHLLPHRRGLLPHRLPQLHLRHPAQAPGGRRGARCAPTPLELRGYGLSVHSNRIMNPRLHNSLTTPRPRSFPGRSLRVFAQVRKLSTTPLWAHPVRPNTIPTFCRSTLALVTIQPGYTADNVRYATKQT